jgi:hypothetical protein
VLMYLHGNSIGTDDDDNGTTTHFKSFQNRREEINQFGKCNNN